jgi:hypothetical protein
MEIKTAQQDIRRVFINGFPGQIVSSCIWFLSAATATWHSEIAGILVLAAGGMFIFPLTQLLLRLMGGPAALPKGHPFNALAMQLAFGLPMMFPLIYAATLHHRYWFYPAFMIAVGAHYLPFIFLYGMKQFGVLSAILVGTGVVIGLYLPVPFSLGGWLTATTLLIFALAGRSVTFTKQREDAQP